MINPLISLGKALGGDKQPATPATAKPVEKSAVQVPSKPSPHTLKKDAAPVLSSLVKQAAQKTEQKSAAPAAPQEPESVTRHRTATAHYEAGRQMWLDRNAKEPPKPEHYQAGLRLLVMSMLASALDPTHQAGATALQIGNQQGQREVDLRNQEAQNLFNRNQQNLGQQAQMEMQAGQREDQLASAAQEQENYLNEMAQRGVDRLTAAKQWQQDYDLRKQAEADRLQMERDQQIGRDFEGALKSASSTDPNLRKLGFAIAGGHLSYNADALRRLGYNPDDYQKSLIDAAGNKTPQQLLQEAMTVEHQATAGQKNAMTPELIAKTKAEVQRIQSASKLDEAKASELNTKLKFLPVEERAKVAKLTSDTALAYQKIRHLKHVDANDVGLRKLMADSDKHIKDYTTEINKLLRERKATADLADDGDKASKNALKSIDDRINNYRHLRNVISQQASRMIQEIAARQGGKDANLPDDDDANF